MAKYFVVKTEEGMAKVAETGEMGIALEKMYGGKNACYTFLI